MKERWGSEGGEGLNNSSQTTITVLKLPISPLGNLNRRRFRTLRRSDVSAVTDSDKTKPEVCIMGLYLFITIIFPRAISGNICDLSSWGMKNVSRWTSISPASRGLLAEMSQFAERTSTHAHRQLTPLIRYLYTCIIHFFAFMICLCRFGIWRRHRSHRYTNKRYELFLFV